MSIKKSLGGDRLGSGAKMNVELHNYERSTHDLGYLWRSTMAPGTLVPFMNMVALPGDTFDIELGADVKTFPTVGPLFGSFKLQLDVFSCPIRLYQSLLHNNKLGIGMKMQDVKLPQLAILTNKLEVDTTPDGSNPVEYQQIDQSSLLAYLGIRGNGMQNQPSDPYVISYKNALPYIAYYDVYKNYFANKQQEIGMYVDHTTPGTPDATSIKVTSGGTTTSVADFGSTINKLVVAGAVIQIYGTDLLSEGILVYSSNGAKSIDNLENVISIGTQSNTYISGIVKEGYYNATINNINTNGIKNSTIKLTEFPLSNIDEMRELILKAGNTQVIIGSGGINITDNYLNPYTDNLQNSLPNYGIKSKLSQQGLAIKTYQSDIFNNWLSTEWIDGANGISAVTAIDTSSGNFTIDTLNLSQKVYEMLNRIAVSGGSYDDWLEAVYTQEQYRKAETPVYMGGLSKEIIFQEVVSQASTKTNDEYNPLGTLAGKGTMSSKHKGGKVTIKVDEPSIIMGIVSITPRIDYSQGNDWYTSIQTMDDFHKPALDEIGFQELITDQMAFFDTKYDLDGLPTYKSAGKQPAWMNYMTNFNKTYGNFANPNSQMFMTLNRRYSFASDGGIEDVTTYIDPSKFNYAFAQTDLNAQNFWVQIGCDVIARRKMSAKVMPNL